MAQCHFGPHFIQQTGAGLTSCAQVVVQRVSVDAEMPCAELDGIAVLACKAGRRGVARRPRQLQIGRRTDQAVDVLIEPRRTAEKPLGVRHVERCAVR